MFNSNVLPSVADVCQPSIQFYRVDVIKQQTEIATDS